jgi:hypothetical protein
LRWRLAKKVVKLREESRLDAIRIAKEYDDKP